jgi:hypothetical protein
MVPKRKASVDDAAGLKHRRSRPANHYAGHIAPRLRDLLPTIFAYVAPSKGGLRAAMLVCRDWANAAGDVLWRHVTTSDLLRVPAERRQHYANRVRELIETCPPAPSADVTTGIQPLSALVFPRLRKLLLNHGARRWQRRSPVRFPEECIGPRLESLTCSDDDLLEVALHARLDLERPLLRALVFRCGYGRPPLDPPTLALKSCSFDTLEVLEQSGPMRMTSGFLALLADRRALKRLILEPMIDGAALDQAF